MNLMANCELLKRKISVIEVKSVVRRNGEGQNEKEG